MEVWSAKSAKRPPHRMVEYQERPPSSNCTVQHIRRITARRFVIAQSQFDATAKHFHAITANPRAYAVTRAPCAQMQVAWAAHLNALYGFVRE